MRLLLLLLLLGGLGGLCHAEKAPALNCSLALRLLRCEDSAGLLIPALGDEALEEQCPEECGRRRTQEEKGGSEGYGHGGGTEGEGEEHGHETEEHKAEEHEAEEHEAEAEEEEEERERWAEANTTWAVFVILILVTLAFESMQETLDEKAGVDLGEIVDELFGELTVLGFIGLLTSALISSGIAEDLSDHIFGAASEAEALQGECPVEEEPQLVEILEDLHMKLFFMMVVFICEVVVLIQIGQTNNLLWAACQDASSDADRSEQHPLPPSPTPLSDCACGCGSAGSRGITRTTNWSRRTARHTEATAAVGRSVCSSATG